jgi:hypothetical protein
MWLNIARSVVLHFSCDAQKGINIQQLRGRPTSSKYLDMANYYQIILVPLAFNKCSTHLNLRL